MTQGLRSTRFVILLWVWFCGCLTGSYWGVYKAWFPSCSEIGLILLRFKQLPLFAFFFLNISFVCFISVNSNLCLYKRKKQQRPFLCQLSLDVFWSSAAHVRIMLFCTYLNIRMADYDGGMHEHIPFGPESKKSLQVWHWISHSQNAWGSERGQCQ